MHVSFLRNFLALFILIAVAGSSFGEESGPPPGSTAFCLFELPANGEKRVLINLAIVQHIEVLRDELKIAYGGGNLGSGHDVRIAFKSTEDANGLLRRLKQAATDCQRKTP